MAEIKEGQNSGQKSWQKHGRQDEAFQKRLLEDPATVLAEEGVKVPEGKNIRVIEAGEDDVGLLLPPKPADKEFAQMGEKSLAASLCDVVCGSI